jgi:hypothetical protein
MVMLVNDIKLMNKANDEIECLIVLIRRSSVFNIHLYDENLECSLKRNLDTTGTIVLVFKPNYIKYSSDSRKVWLFFTKSELKDGTRISMRTSISFFQ